MVKVLKAKNPIDAVIGRDFIDYTSEMMHEGGDSQPSTNEVVMFLQVLLYMCFYGCSARDYFGYDGMYSKTNVETMTLSKFESLKKMLEKGMKQTSSSVQELFDRMAAKWRKIFLTNERKSMHITIDDGKQNSRSEKVSELNAARKKIKDNYGAVVHIAMSTISGGILAMHLEENRQTDVDCVKSLLGKTFDCYTDTSLASKVQLRPEVLIYFDRGYNTKKTSSWVSQIGFSFLGTEAYLGEQCSIRPMENTLVLKECRLVCIVFDNQYNGNQNWQVKSGGAYAMYWAESSVDIVKTSRNAAKRVVIKHMCARNGFGKYIRLSTNIVDLKPNDYELYHARTTTSNAISAVCTFKGGEALYKQKFEDFLNSVQVLTSGQG